jgi:anti-sigma factor ChrR (cupin superfamily)
LSADDVKPALARLVVSGLFGTGTDFDRFEWLPFREGVEIARLYGGGDLGPTAALLRYAPGASVPNHLHRGNEHIIVLRGSQRDAEGVYEAGTLMAHGAGSQHSVSSDQGCIVLAIWCAPVEITD